MKRCSENMQKIYRKSPCQKTILIKLLSNFIEITLRYGCSPVKLLYIFRTHFPKCAPGGLLLKTYYLRTLTNGQINKILHKNNVA